MTVPAEIRPMPNVVPASLKYRVKGRQKPSVYASNPTPLRRMKAGLSNAIPFRLLTDGPLPIIFRWMVKALPCARTTPRFPISMTMRK